MIYPHELFSDSITPRLKGGFVSSLLLCDLVEVRIRQTDFFHNGPFVIVNHNLSVCLAGVDAQVILDHWFPPESLDA